MQISESGTIIVTSVRRKYSTSLAGPLSVPRLSASSRGIVELSNALCKLRVYLDSSYANSGPQGRYQNSNQIASRSGDTVWSVWASGELKTTGSRKGIYSLCTEYSLTYGFLWKVAGSAQEHILAIAKDLYYLSIDPDQLVHPSALAQHISMTDSCIPVPNGSRYYTRGIVALLFSKPH